MRTIILTLLLVANCSPETHVLLATDAGVDGGFDAGVDAGPSCGDVQTEDTHGMPCLGGGGCSSAAPGPTPLFVAQCFTGEWITARGSVDYLDRSEACSGEIEVRGAFATFERIDGPCFDLLTCRSSATTNTWIRKSMCQAGGRTSIRSSSLEPWSDCEAVLAGGLDGEPCVGDLRCGGSSPSRPAIVAYCDDLGMLRLLPGDLVGFAP